MRHHTYNPSVLSKVLYIGIDYARSKGGVPDVEKYIHGLFGGVKHVPTTLDGSKPAKFIACASGLCQYLGALICDKDIRIVHVHGCGGASVWRKCIYMRLARAFGKKVVYHVHSGRFIDTVTNHPRLARNVANLSDVIVALSPVWKSELARLFPNARIEIVPNGVIPLQCPAAHRKNNDELTVLFLGKIRQDKGVYDLLDAVEQVKTDGGLRIRLIIAGVGETAKLRSEISKRNLADVVEYVGWVDGDKKAALLSKADVFALPSYYEGMPVSILEAMNYGLPILATPVGGIPDLVSEGVNGLLVSPGDVPAIAQALGSLASCPEMRLSMGERNHECVKGYYPDAIRRKLCDVYGSLL